jgi:biotin synthase-related radical SAM superfamily protein
MDLPPIQSAFFFGKSTLVTCPVFPDHYNIPCIVKEGLTETQVIETPKRAYSKVMESCMMDFCEEGMK